MSADTTAECFSKISTVENERLLPELRLHSNNPLAAAAAALQTKSTQTVKKKKKILLESDSDRK